LRGKELGTSRITYNFEYKEKLRICFIGAGGHSFRNIYPTFQYAPVELLAVCDNDKNRAASYAKQFGAARYYNNYLDMLDEEKPDAVFIVTSYHDDGRVQATDIALDVLNSGAHVWMEKPTAASVEEIERLMEVSKQKNKYVMTGLKKVFFPSIEKVKEITSLPEFGKPSSFYIRYPQPIPELSRRKDLRNVTGLLDHIYHPGAIIHYLMGKIKHIYYEWEPNNGGSVTSIAFETGAIGTLHMTAGVSSNSPLERLEIIGEGANIVVENGVKVTYYRKAKSLEYGRTGTYLVDTGEAPVHWEPEFSLGQLYNKNIFYLGYVQEVLHFCESIQKRSEPTKGTLQDSLEIMKLFEGYRFNPPGEKIVLN
jgi:predicted dehydrogenase